MTQLTIFGPAESVDRAVCGDSCAVPPATGDLAHAYAAELLHMRGRMPATCMELFSAGMMISLICILLQQAQSCLVLE